MAAPWEPPAQTLPWDRAVLPPPPGFFWTLPKPGCETAAARRPAPEVSLWTVLAAMQAVERKVELHAGQLRRLERRADLTERKLSGTEKTLSDFGPHLDALGRLIQAYGQLRKRLDHMEELLKDYSCWVLNVPPGARGEASQVPLNFANVSVYCSEQEWEDLNAGPKARQKTEDSVASVGCTASKPDSLSPVEDGGPLSGKPRGHSGEAEDRTDATVLLPTSTPAETEPGKLGQFSPSPELSEEKCVLPSSEEDLARVAGRTAALQRSSETGGDVANFTTIVVQEGVLPGEAPYVCLDCGRSFLYEEQRALHQQSHLRAAPDPGGSPAQPSRPEVRAYTCPDCGRWFPHQASLSKHRLWHTGERPHTCAECKKTFRLKINLHLHERTHAVAKKAGYYICGQCGRTFNHHSNFLRHQMIHTGERPYACGECGKTFIRKEHLATHGRLHTGERPYQCSLCPKSFTRKQHLVGHQRLHEGEAIWLEDHRTQRDGQGQADGIGIPVVAVEPLGPETYPP